MGTTVPSRQSLFAAMLVLILTASSCGWLDSLSARNELNQGVSAYTSKKYDEAIEHFQENIDKGCDVDFRIGPLAGASAHSHSYLPRSSCRSTIKPICSTPASRALDTRSTTVP